MSYNIQAQEIKFPKSFHGDASLFEGMKIAEIPQEAQTKYDIHKNPGLISDASKTKGFLMNGKIKNVKAVYFEIYKDLEEEEEEKTSCGFEVAQFDLVDEMEKILPKTDKQSESVILLTLENYLIMVYGPVSNNVGKRLDDMSNYFQKKLGDKLIRDRKREVVTSVVDDYVSNLPPPLPPEPKNSYTQIAIEDLDKRIANTDGLAYMRTKKREKLTPGKYRATSTYPTFETLSFTLNENSLLHGDYDDEETSKIIEKLKKL